MKLIDIDVFIDSYSFKKEFNLSTHCVSSLVLASLFEFESSPCRKVSIELNKEKKESESSPVQAGDIFLLTDAFDFERYFKLNDQDKKHEILDVIFRNLVLLAEKCSWDVATITNTYNSLKLTELKNFRYLKKKKSNPSRKLKIQLGYHHEIDCIRIVGHLFNKKDELIEEVNFAKIEPHEWFLVQYVGDVKWLSNTEVCLTPKNPDIDAIKIELDH